MTIDSQLTNRLLELGIKDVSECEPEFSRYLKQEHWVMVEYKKNVRFFAQEYLWRTVLGMMKVIE